MRRTCPLASTLVLGAMTRVAGNKRDKEDVAEAIEMLDEAIDLFPPQVSIESFDPLLAKALAWRAATRAAVLSDNSFMDGVQSRRHKEPDTARVKWTGQTRRAENCEFDWKKDNKPRYPSSGVVRNMLSGVVIGYHFDATGRTTGARILSEVPAESEFGRATLKAIKGWSLKSPPKPGCRFNNLLIMHFYIKGR